MITHLEPDILEHEVKWALGSITRNKLVEVMEFQLSYFKFWKMICESAALNIPANLENSAVATQQWPQNWKRSVFIPISKKSNAKECSNYSTIALMSHASNVMLKILQVRLHGTWTMKFQMFKLDLEKAVEPEIKLPTSAGSSKKQENLKKKIYFTDCTKAFDCVNHNRLWKILQEMGPPEKPVCRSKSNS